MWLMQSAGDADRIRGLTISTAKVENVGNLKYDLRPGNQQERDHIAASIKDLFCPQSDCSLIIAGSTTTDEEPIILDAFRMLRNVTRMNQIQLMIAPRHPERFNEVASMIEKSGFTFVRRSQMTAADSEGSVADVILLDTIGELAAVFPLASIVFIGGSLMPKGGHNILEPAACAKPIIVGPHMENFRQIMKDFAARNAVIQLPDVEPSGLTKALASTWAELILNESLRQKLGDAAHAVTLENRGAAERCADKIIGLLHGCSKSDSARV
jgi:3-deoxy-D-manno-octulosonic-acid transferase